MAINELYDCRVSLNDSLKWCVGLSNAVAKAVVTYRMGFHNGGARPCSPHVPFSEPPVKRIHQAHGHCISDSINSFLEVYVTAFSNHVLDASPFRLSLGTRGRLMAGALLLDALPYLLICPTHVPTIFTARIYGAQGSSIGTPDR